MKTILWKLGVSLLLIAVGSAALFLYIRAGGNALTGAGGGMPLLLVMAAVAVAVVIALFFPRDIQQASLGKKWLVGIVTFVLLMVLFFAGMIGAAMLLG